MGVESDPYLWMGGSRRGGWNAWLEYPAGVTSHADLVEVAERLRRDFGAVIIEQYPERPSDDSKEYLWLRIGSATLMLMRKPPHCPVGLCVESGDVGLLVRIGRAWGVQRFVGWRWRLWRALRRLLRQDT
jgi:hypothetical protein